ncbi:phosphoenolpyruvate carboxylase kinase 1 [Prunus yedoensis var. nudiflora]|uniref:Phosphoenolpyruvate carboxylase kinase 1 n=1 Tax=Prunus yedoensis var. nudiflora TaxID=2094558 RepID=A0A314XST3_PRUYE|nr:phosphoenolpyruvate carboxylase kinase 1 [Prunus yedoensis var. nudiflora]
MYDTLKDAYQLFEEIGRGRFGTIIRAFCPNSAEFVACKIIDKSGLTDAQDRACLEKEPKIMSLLAPHPNILKLFNVFETDDSLAMVLELCEPVLSTTGSSSARSPNPKPPPSSSSF